MGEEVLQPVFGIRCVIHHARTHAQNIADRQLLQILRRVFRCFFREDVDDALIEPQFSLPQGNADRSCGIGFRMALQAMTDLRPVGFPPALGNHCVMAHDHQSVHFRICLFQCIDVIQDGLG